MQTGMSRKRIWERPCRCVAGSSAGGRNYVRRGDPVLGSCAMPENGEHGQSGRICQPLRLERRFFFHNKSANNIFCQDLSAKRTKTF